MRLTALVLFLLVMPGLVLADNPDIPLGQIMLAPGLAWESTKVENEPSDWTTNSFGLTLGIPANENNSIFLSGHWASTSLERNLDMKSWGVSITWTVYIGARTQGQTMDYNYLRPARK